MTAFLTNLSFLAGLVSFVWIVALGGFSHLIFGVVAIVLFPWIVTLLHFPAVWLQRASAALHRRGWDRASLPVYFFGFLYVLLYNITWTVLLFFHYAVVPHDLPRLPLALWGYFVAVAPVWFAVTRFGDRSKSSFLIVLWVALCYIGLAACLNTENALMNSALYVAGLVFVISLIVLRELISTLNAMLNADASENQTI